MFLSSADRNALELSRRWLQDQNQPSSAYRMSFDSFEELQVLSGVGLASGSHPLTSPHNFNSNKDSYIEVFPGWPTYESKDRSSSIGFAGLSLSVTRANNFFPAAGALSPVNHREKIINGKLLSFTFGGDELEGMQSVGTRTRITFRHDLPAFGDRKSVV